MLENWFVKFDLFLKIVEIVVWKFDLNLICWLLWLKIDLWMKIVPCQHLLDYFKADVGHSRLTSGIDYFSSLVLYLSYILHGLSPTIQPRNLMGKIWYIPINLYIVFDFNTNFILSKAVETLPNELSFTTKVK